MRRHITKGIRPTESTFVANRQNNLNQIHTLSPCIEIGDWELRMFNALATNLFPGIVAPMCLPIHVMTARTLSSNEMTILFWINQVPYLVIYKHQMEPEYFTLVMSGNWFD